MHTLKMKMWKKVLIGAGIAASAVASASYIVRKVQGQDETPEVADIPVKKVKVKRDAIPTKLIMEEDTPLNPVTFEESDDQEDDDDDDNKAYRDIASEYD